jgi:hypothetical protein
MRALLVNFTEQESSMNMQELAKQAQAKEEAQAHIKSLKHALEEARKHELEIEFLASLAPVERDLIATKAERAAAIAYAHEEARLNDRFDTMTREELHALIGTLHERSNMTDAEYAAAFPNSPYNFPSVDAWLLWIDAERGLTS